MAIIKHTDAFKALAAEEFRYPLAIVDPPYELWEAQKKDLLALLRKTVWGTTIIFGTPENQYPTPDQYMFWIKPTSTKNTCKRYSRFVEMMFLYNFEGRGQWDSKRHWSQYTNVFHDLVDGDSEHPHEKPASLIKRLILNHTNLGDEVLDPFAGSGKVLRVCNTLKRGYIGFEADKERFDKIVLRCNDVA
jgi:DNA methylase